MYRISAIASLIAVAFCLYSSVSLAIDKSLLRLATTSSVQNSGLLGQLIVRFEEESGYKVKVFVVGSGAALRMGRKGQADAIISHAPEAERKFIEEGYAAIHRPLMHNDFLLVGPAGDPAAIRGLADTVRALNRIAVRRHTFVSRADGSGTHERELKLWRASGFDPFGKPWYLETGMDMADTLKQGDDLQGYLLVDRGTWLAMRSSLKLVPLCFGDPRLINFYSVMAIRDNPHLEVNERAGRTFVEWMTSDEVRMLISAYTVDGEHLFTHADDASWK